jgi:hypothetical protein
VSSALDRFERALVQASEQLSAAATASGVPRRRTSLTARVLRRRGPLLAIVGTVLLAGGAATAASLLSSGQKLADGFVYCYPTTWQSRFVAGAPADGQAPTALCRRVYRRYDNTHPVPATAGLIACRSSTTTVAVYLADDRTDQCQANGDAPLPSTYHVALKSLHQLERDLASLERHRQCISPRALAGAIRRDLSRLGLDAWSITLPSASTPNGPAGTGGGPCASLVPDRFDNPPSAISTDPDVIPGQQTVQIQAALPRHTDQAIYLVQRALYARTYSNCYSASSVRHLVSRAFAPLHLTARYATTRQTPGTSYEPASQRLYARGCVRFNFAFPSNDDAWVDVWLVAKSGAPLANARPFPPAGQFKP